MTSRSSSRISPSEYAPPATSLPIGGDRVVAQDTRPSPPPVPTGFQVPTCDTRDPAQLAAFYGPFGWADHFRKVVLSNCTEVLRASFAMQDQKVTEARLGDLAHIHPAYIEFLTTHLLGRIEWEREVVKRGIGG